MGGGKGEIEEGSKKNKAMELVQLCNWKKRQFVMAWQLAGSHSKKQASVWHSMTYWSRDAG